MIISFFRVLVIGVILYDIVIVELMVVYFVVQLVLVVRFFDIMFLLLSVIGLTLIPVCIVI